MIAGDLNEIVAIMKHQEEILCALITAQDGCTKYEQYMKRYSTSFMQISSKRTEVQSILTKKYGDDIDTKHILNCYALQKELKNTFIYRSPISFDVNYTEDERLYTIDGVNINSQSEFNLLINNSMK